MWRISIGAFLALAFVLPASADTPFKPAEVCRAAVGAVMGRSPQIIHVDRVKDDVHFLSYIRPSDKSRWAYRCKLQKNNYVLWASEPGRWRDDPRDDKVRFEASEQKLTIIQEFADGSTSTETYSRHQF